MSALRGSSLSVIKRIVAVAFLGIALAMAPTQLKASCSDQYSNCNVCDEFGGSHPYVDFYGCTNDCSDSTARCQAWCEEQNATEYYSYCQWQPDTQIGSGECGCS
jgi:hypothetical protein